MSGIENFACCAVVMSVQYVWNEKITCQLNFTWINILTVNDDHGCIKFAVKDFSAKLK